MSKFKCATIFSDNMVFQRNKPVCIFGTGEEGLKIRASIGGSFAEGRVYDGHFKLYLPKQEAGENLTVTVTDGEDSVSFTNVAIGEVWIAGGQSNMELELHNAVAGMDALKNDKPNVRFFYTPKIAYEDECFAQMEEWAHWETFNEQDAAKWSAVAYFFAKELSEKLGVTVGIVGCNWGGTSASCWIPRSDIEGDEILDSYLDELRKNSKGVSFDSQKETYNEYLEYAKNWDEKCAEMYAKNPNADWQVIQDTIGECRYPGPVNECNPVRPGGLYVTMVSKVIAYTCRGVIFYQGESDDHRPNDYERLYKFLIRRWRNDNKDSELPFIGVQLPMHRYKADPDYKHWPIIRQAQRKVATDEKNVGLAVAIDCGEFNEIHPKDKRPVGHRLYLQAANMVYGTESPEKANSPRLKRVLFSKDCAEVCFDFTDGGFLLKNESGEMEPLDNYEVFENEPDNEITGFEIASSDGNFVEARAEIISKNTVRVYSKQVPNPCYVRYLWTNWSDVVLYGANGLPVEPFYSK